MKGRRGLLSLPFWGQEEFSPSPSSLCQRTGVLHWPKSRPLVQSTLWKLDQVMTSQSNKLLLGGHGFGGQRSSKRDGGRRRDYWISDHRHPQLKEEEEALGEKRRRLNWPLFSPCCVLEIGALGNCNHLLFIFLLSRKAGREQSS